MNLRIIRLKGKGLDKKNAYFMLPFSMYVPKFCTSAVTEGISVIARA